MRASDIKFQRSLWDDLLHNVCKNAIPLLIVFAVLGAVIGW
ncbi:hypothetical protein ACL598_19345 [Bordetella bronchialis]